MITEAGRDYLAVVRDALDQIVVTAERCHLLVIVSLPHAEGPEWGQAV